MQLSLERIVPLLLKERLSSYHSQVWGQELVFNPGERILVQAPSGAGKSMLLQILYGLRNDYEGKVHWSAYSMYGIRPQDLAKLRASFVSMVFQDFKLFDQLTVSENVELKRRVTNTVTEYNTEKWLGKVGLKERLDAIVGKLSQGERQRLSIVRALAQPFEWLMLDEPFSHLDEFNRQRSIALINEVAELTKAGIIITDVEDNDYFTYDKKLFL